jgi:hypothetical protein
MKLGKVVAKVLSSPATPKKRTVPNHVIDIMEMVLFTCHPQMAY